MPWKTDTDVEQYPFNVGRMYWTLVVCVCVSFIHLLNTLRDYCAHVIVDCVQFYMRVETLIARSILLPRT